MLLTCFTAFACSAYCQSNNQQPVKQVKLSDLSVQPSNPNGPGKPDPKPAPAPGIMESPNVKKVQQIYKDIGSPKPILKDNKTGVSVTKEY